MVLPEFVMFESLLSNCLYLRFSSLCLISAHVLYTSQYPVAQTPAAADIICMSLNAQQSPRCAQRYIGPAYTCLAHCSVMNARPPAAQVVWQALCLIWQ